MVIFVQIFTLSHFHTGIKNYIIGIPNPVISIQYLHYNVWYGFRAEVAILFRCLHSARSPHIRLPPFGDFCRAFGFQRRVMLVITANAIIRNSGLIHTVTYMAIYDIYYYYNTRSILYFIHLR